PWPALAGERRLRTGAGPATVIHATQPDLVPSGPVVATCYDLIPLRFRDEYLAGPGRLPEALAYRRQMARLRAATLVVAISQETAADLRNLARVDAGRIRVVPLGGPLSAEPTAPHEPSTRPHSGESVPEGPFALYSGSLEPHKNLTLLVDALAALGDRAPDLRLVLTGPWSPGRLARLRDRAEEAGVAGRILWLGHVPTSELAALRARALCQVVPSRAEGDGLPVLEAMAAGLPVLAGDTPAVREVAGEAARLLPVDAPVLWAQELAALAADPAVAGRLRAAGIARAVGFGWTATAEALWEVYAEAAAA
ncbi:MAG: glycosyltransferase family 1 protein, partial [Miltoncostaeaceae bacterium]